MEHSTRFSDAAIAGAASGFVSRMLVSPLDVLKIRWQNAHGSTPTSVSSSLKTILSSHGYSGLFRGNSYGIAIWVAYGAVQFPAYEKLKDLVPISPERYSKTNHFVAGSLAAGFATLLTFPLDAMRTRMITSNQHHSRNLSRGLQSGLIAIVPMAGLTFCLHESLRQVTGDPASSGLVAGMLSKTCFYPLDTIKRRLMTQGMLHAETNLALPTYKSQWDCASRMFWEEGGLRSFFRGLTPAMIKTGLGSGCTFFVYEATLKHLNELHQVVIH